MKNLAEETKQLGSRPSKANLKGLGIAMVYGTTSASMAFANKALLNTYNFNFPIFIVVVQMVLSIAVLEVLRLFGRIDLPRYTLERGKTFLLPSVFYALNSVLALWALSGMNIPMYGVMKRCAPLVILLLGPLILKKGPPSIGTIVSVTFITLGCIIAGYGDLGFHPKEYTVCAISVISQALYLVLVQKSSQTYSATETLHLNSYNTLPFLLVTGAMFSELWQGLLHFRYLNPEFVAVFFLVVGMGCLLNYLLFLCTVYNSALTTSIAGTLKSVVQTAIGMFTFGGISMNVFTVTGITMNLSGGALYTYAKLRDSRMKAVKEAEVSKNHDMENGNLPNKGLTDDKEHK